MDASGGGLCVPSHSSLSFSLLHRSPVTVQEPLPLQPGERVRIPAPDVLPIVDPVTIVAVEAPILNGFGDVRRLDRGTPHQVGDRARDLEHSMIRPRREGDSANAGHEHRIL